MRMIARAHSSQALIFGSVLRPVAVCIAREIELGLELDQGKPRSERGDKSLPGVRRAIPWRRRRL